MLLLGVHSSFVWGIFIFDEKVKSFRGIVLALAVLIVGLVGMSVYASPPATMTSSTTRAEKKKISYKHSNTPEWRDDENLSSRNENSFLPASFRSIRNKITRVLLSYTNKNNSGDPTSLGTIVSINDCTTSSATTSTSSTSSLSSSSCSSSEIMTSTTAASAMSNITSTSIRTRKNKQNNQNHDTKTIQISSSNEAETVRLNNKQSYYLDDVESSRRTAPGGEVHASSAGSNKKQKNPVIFIDLPFFNGGRICLSQRQLGLMGAIFNGTWGSCKYIPMHYTGKKSLEGAGYLISYSFGSMIVVTITWALRYLYNVHHFQGNYSKAFRALPPFYFQHLCIPGLAAGMLWSFANFCSILAVSALGQGVGYTFVQSSMLVSGLWGILYGEIKGSDRIMKWFISSVITIFGISLVSYEHE